MFPLSYIASNFETGEYLSESSYPLHPSLHWEIGSNAYVCFADPNSVRKSDESVLPLLFPLSNPLSFWLLLWVSMSRASVSMEFMSSLADAESLLMKLKSSKSSSSSSRLLSAIEYRRLFPWVVWWSAGRMSRRFESLILVSTWAIIFAHILALLTICSSKDGSVSSSSGLQRIYPISLRVKPAAAPFFSNVHEILIFRRHFDLNLNVCSSILMSAIMSMF